MANYTAKELAELLQEEDKSINLRTIRYYTQIGMLPPLELVGNKRVYIDTHLHYLRAIRTLSKTGISLKEIQERLTNLSIGEIQEIGKKIGFLESSNVLNHETHKITEDAYITISKNISVETKQKVIHSITNILSGEKQNDKH
ncbi:MerR family transcriptional regulator [Fictibacillus sp. 23RED33]|uniref:MerR family transcriptional regulator n=1 Tax=Fictibacillus sp. 23RED33 TaxID=2745879 RepID=UPI0018CDB29B|nr:MerR family transcriptional regulator [Fictibacillus sp. 23RED33]MBH0173884.1 MerR family transcriptional regulator [Fictibacillus sp. 23RED33]